MPKGLADTARSHEIILRRTISGHRQASPDQIITMPKPSAIAIGAQDDIEFYMAGTLLQLQAAGWTFIISAFPRYLGSVKMPPEDCSNASRKPARARVLGATITGICRDHEILYTVLTRAKWRRPFVKTKRPSC